MTELSYDDKVWVDAEQKLDGVCRDLAEANLEGLNVLLVAHFETMLSAVAQKLRARSIQYRTYSSAESVALCAANSTASPLPKVWLVPASHLRTGVFDVASKPGEPILRVLVAEHHPTLSRDKTLLAALAQLPCRCRTTFHVALTDPLLARFVGEGVRTLLVKLGQAEDESLSHPLISTSIRNAQEKVGQQARGEIPTLSAEEWFKHNMWPTTS